MTHTHIRHTGVRKLLLSKEPEKIPVQSFQIRHEFHSFFIRTNKSLDLFFTIPGQRHRPAANFF